MSAVKERPVKEYAKRCGRTYVAVPRAVIAKWQHRPFSEMLVASETGVDGISRVIDPGMDREIEVDEPDDSGKVAKVKKMIFIEEYPYRVKDTSVFRLVGKKDGWSRDDVATLHTQNW
jgi:hypothetical protein